MDTIITALTDSISWLVDALRRGAVSRALALVVIGLPVLLAGTLGWVRSGALGLVIFSLIGFLVGAAILYVLAKRGEDAARQTKRGKGVR